MKHTCNDKWETIDSKETLYLQAVWQALSPSHTEFFDLPMVMCAMHPLGFVTAHDRHGLQMRTRQTMPQLFSINDWDGSWCNILIETCISNNAKSTFPAEQHDQTKLDVKSVEVGAKQHRRSDLEGTGAVVEQEQDEAGSRRSAVGRDDARN